MPVLTAAALLPLLLLPVPLVTGLPAVPSSPSPGVLRAAEAAYRWPVVPPRVVRRFAPPPQRWLPGHRGVDLASSAGAMVRAAAAGVVVHAGTLAGRGVVSVAHTGQLRTTYEPVTATVRVGDRVAAGDPIGTVEAGHPGCAQTACLHWGLRRGDVYLDPLALLGLGRVRLLPLDGR